MSDLDITIDRSPALSLEAYVFPKSEDWKAIVDNENPQHSKIFQVPGTWTREIHVDGVAPSKASGPVLAFISCPNCKNVLILHSKVHKIDHKCKVTPDFKCNHCEFHRKIYLDEFHDKPLYACAIEKFEGKRVIPEIIYCQGLDTAEARRNLGVLMPNQKLVAIARAIGFQAGNKDGSILIAR
jgi:hypothetical protein